MGLRAWTAIAVVVMGFSAGVARADLVRVQFPTRVAVGEKPFLTIIATEPIDGLDVSLRDDTGHPTSARLGPLGPGGQHRVSLPATPGRHRYEGELTVKKGAGAERRAIAFETVIAPRLEISIDRARVDLAGRRLEARLSRPAARAEITILAASGETVARAEQDLRGQAAGAPLVITWPAPTPADADVARIDLRLEDVDGFYASVALLPWRMSIPHEEVVFATDSAAIGQAERPKLEASFAKIADAFAHHQNLGPVKLYIAGHTDTVGSPAHNLELSRARAAAIATWFRKRGLRLPILCEGFGEFALLVPTPDETAEARNRRVDYILALEDPPMASAKFRPTWRPR